MATLTFSGRRLRAACDERHFTAQVLAQRSGRSISSVYKWWTGRARPGANELASIAQALGVPLEALYTRYPDDVDEQAAQAPAKGRVA